MLRSGSALTLAPITVILALLALGCSGASVSPGASLLTTPNIPGTLVPTVPQIDVAKIDPNTNDSEVVSNEPLVVSLQPIAMDGWSSPLIVAASAGATESSAIQQEGQIFITWAITNRGTESANTPFSIDLLFDGIPVERWSSKGLFVEEVQSVKDWDLLPTRTLITPGTHSITLVVDSTNYVKNNDSRSSTFSTTFEWPVLPSNSPDISISPARLPNLTPSIPSGWDSPISVTGIPTEPIASHLLKDPRLQIAYSNSGLSSIVEMFLVHTYLDDVLVAKFSQMGLVSEEMVITPPWRRLLDTVRISNGIHKITIKLDPTNLISEEDESDNSASMFFYWGEPKQTTLLPEPVAPMNRANIVSYVPTGWSGPLIITSYPGRTGALGSIYRDSEAFVSWAIKNVSPVQMESPITIELVIGDTLLHSWNFERLEAGQLVVVLDEPISVIPNPGVYEIQLRFQMNSTEGPNNISKVLARRNAGWLSGTTPTSKTPTLEASAIARRINAIESMRSSKEAPVYSDNQLTGILGVVQAVYQTLHKTNLYDEPLTISVLTDEEFAQWVDAECDNVAQTLEQAVRTLYLARCDATKEYIGYHTSWRGAFRIVVKGDRSPMEVLSTIAHELGHFRQSFTNPQLDNRANLDVLALREAQAYAHQVLFFRTLEKLAGLDLLLYPKIAGYETFIEEQLASLREQAQTSEHARGQLVLWLALLVDTNLRSERTILLNNLSIPVETASAYFDYLVDFTPSEARLYVTKLMEDISVQFGAIEAIALARLVPGLPYWTEGSPSLREIGLLLP